VDTLRRKRLVRIFFIFWLCFLGLMVRLWVIQIKDGYNYSCQALAQGSRWVSLEEAPRGGILDRNLVPLTGEKEEDRVVLFPMAVADKDEVARDLAGLLGVDYPMVTGYLEGGPCLLPYRVGPAQSAAIKERGWPGVMVLPVQFRYGDRPLAAQTIGHLGRISSREEFSALAGRGGKIYRYDDMVGKTGLEKYYEQVLKGVRPQRAVRVFADAGGRLLGGPEFRVEEDVVDRERRDLVLTIDSRIQLAVEDIMDRRVARGAVVIVEAGSGDILALASRPGFNPARPEQYLGGGMEERFFDHCIALYQPGSIFKVVVAAAALEEGLVGPESRFTCHGERDDLIHCWKAEGHGEIDFSRAFADSCNPAFAETGLKLGASRLIEYAGRLGLANQSITGYPAPRDPRQDHNLIGAPHNLVNSSVGQGPVLVTPVQVAAMLNTIVSGGVYREPRLAREVHKKSGEVVRAYPLDPGKRAISSETAEKLRVLLESVVDHGVGREAGVPVYGSAGKTGSAQIGNGSVNAWFAGYAPRSNPRYVVTVLVEKGASGGESAAPVFREIMERILQ